MMHALLGRLLVHAVCNGTACKAHARRTVSTEIGLSSISGPLRLLRYHHLAKQVWFDTLCRGQAATPVSIDPTC